MKKKYKSNFIIKCDIYPFEVMVSIDQTNDQLFKALEPYGYIRKECEELWDMSETVQGKCIMTTINHTIIRLKSMPDKYLFMGNIAHEVFHAVTFIMSSIGMKFKLEVSDEAYSYLTGYLTERIYRELKL